ncbi:Xaa-Pro peptidase family protein [Haloechinothrix salitolerans]|uniref:Xaa-Pro peptidase family protein n=1 Tax=Haloechinothrix salitolerans TaxID=926830 RepID=A0ABW2C7H4_9PSEU
MNTDLSLATSAHDPALDAANPTPDSEHAARLAALRARMADADLAAVALASPERIYYLTGLDHLGYFAFTLLLVPATGEPVIVTRAMERPTIAAQLPHCRHVTFADGDDPAIAVAAVLGELVPNGATVGVEASALFFPPTILARIRAATPWLHLRDTDALLSDAMAVKSPAEIALTRRAAGISDAAMTAGISAARPGAGEHDVAAAVHHAMYAAGGQQPGFAPLIRPLSLLNQEHVSWQPRPLEAGTGLFLELSGCVARYHAPLSRTIYLGGLPDGAAEAHAAALAGLHAARDALRPGVTTGQVYARWQHAVAGSDSPAWPLRHHCGYLVGIGFPPSWVGGGEVLGIRADGGTPIAAGMTFHLMSWVAGHVVSDTALVTPHDAELLTTTPRDLTVVI